MREEVNVVYLDEGNPVGLLLQRHLCALPPPLAVSDI